ncbi:MAG TPA: diphthine--ammonia ligase [Candidatus Aquilonibacter sp.]|nr:diphthine--ammonia ligase [Candidatus Aquilonibacter sp.]
MTNACLFSGGKDSNFALQKAIASGIKIDLLITVQTQNDFSYMFHYPNIEATKLQAEALGIPQVIVKTKGLKEDEVIDLERALVDNDVKLFVSGAIASEYQKERVDGIAKRNKMKSIAPLWHIDPEVELKEIVDNYEVIISQVSAEGFDRSYVGAKIDAQMVERLRELKEKHGINLLFEGGEAETFVLNAPLFKKKIVIEESETLWNGSVGRFVIKKAKLVDK